MSDWNGTQHGTKGGPGKILTAARKDAEREKKNAEREEKKRLRELEKGVAKQEREKRKQEEKAAKEAARAVREQAKQDSNARKEASKQARKREQVALRNAAEANAVVAREDPGGWMHIVARACAPSLLRRNNIDVLGKAIRGDADKYKVQPEESQVVVPRPGDGHYRMPLMIFAANAALITRRLFDAFIWLITNYYYPEKPESRGTTFAYSTQLRSRYMYLASCYARGASDTPATNNDTHSSTAFNVRWVPDGAWAREAGTYPDVALVPLTTADYVFMMRFAIFAAGNLLAGTEIDRMIIDLMDHADRTDKTPEPLTRVSTVWFQYLLNCKEDVAVNLFFEAVAARSKGRERLLLMARLCIKAFASDTSAPRRHRAAYVLTNLYAVLRSSAVSMDWADLVAQHGLAVARAGLEDDAAKFLLKPPFGNVSGHTTYETTIAMRSDAKRSADESVAAYWMQSFAFMKDNFAGSGLVTIDHRLRGGLTDGDPGPRAPFFYKLIKYDRTVQAYRVRNKDVDVAPNLLGMSQFVAMLDYIPYDEQAYKALLQLKSQIEPAARAHGNLRELNGRRGPGRADVEAGNILTMTRLLLDRLDMVKPDPRFRAGGAGRPPLVEAMYKSTAISPIHTGMAVMMRAARDVCDSLNVASLSVLGRPRTAHETAPDQFRVGAKRVLDMYATGSVDPLRVVLRTLSGGVATPSTESVREFLGAYSAVMQRQAEIVSSAERATPRFYDSLIDASEPIEAVRAWHNAHVFGAQLVASNAIVVDARDCAVASRDVKVSKERLVAAAQRLEFIFVWFEAMGRVDPFSAVSSGHWAEGRGEEVFESFANAYTEKHHARDRMWGRRNHESRDGYTRKTIFAVAALLESILAIECEIMVALTWAYEDVA